MNSAPSATASISEVSATAVSKRFACPSIFSGRLNSETASANAILPFLLTRASKKYPDYTKLNEHLAELYGAELDADVQKLGDTQVLSVSVTGLADRYALNGEQISAELSHLLCSMLFEPPFQDGLFPEDGFEQEKRQMMETLDSEFNDKRLYALRRCEEIMCADEPYGIGRYGTKEDIRNLKRESLNEAWHRMIHSAKAEILVLGDCDPEPVYHDFSAAFQNLGRACADKCPNLIRKSVGQAERRNREDGCCAVETRYGLPGRLCGTGKGSSGHETDECPLRRYAEFQTVSQCARKDEPLLLLQFGVQSRSRESLRCRAASSRKTSNVRKTEILAQLEEVKKGNFTDDDLSAAKLSLCNSYHTISDSLDSLEGWYLSKTFSDPGRTPEQEAEMISAVTREELIAAARQVTLDTVYRLTGNGGERLMGTESEIKESKSERTGDRYFEIKHSSGLRIFIYPKENNNSTYAVFGTKYGSIDNCFQATGDARSRSGSRTELPIIWSTSFLKAKTATHLHATRKRELAPTPTLRSI